MYNPSIKTIKEGLGVSREIAKTIRGLFDGSIDVNDYSQTWEDNPFIYNYNEVEKILHVINILLEGYGVECVRGQYVDHYHQDINLSYVNKGDTYDTTVVRDHLKNQWYICSWGNIVESESKRFDI